MSVVQDGAIVDKLPCADGMVTNCCFGGTELYITDSRNGTLWRYDLGVGGLPLHTGPDPSGPVVAAHRQRGEHDEEGGRPHEHPADGGGVNVTVHEPA